MSTITIDPPVTRPDFDFGAVTVTDDAHEPADLHDVCHFIDPNHSVLCGAASHWGVPPEPANTRAGRCTHCKKRRCPACETRVAK